MNFWAPALGEVSLNVTLFVRPSVYSQRKISEMTLQFFLIFCIKIDGHKVRKLTKYFEKSVLKKSPVGSGGSKNKVLEFLTKI